MILGWIGYGGLSLLVGVAVIAVIALAPLGRRPAAPARRTREVGAYRPSSSQRVRDVLLVVEHVERDAGATRATGCHDPCRGQPRQVAAIEVGPA